MYPWGVFYLSLWLWPVISWYIAVAFDVIRHDNERVLISCVIGVAQFVSYDAQVVPNFIRVPLGFGVKAVEWSPVMVMAHLLSDRHYNVLLLRPSFLQHQEAGLGVVVGPKRVMREVYYRLDVVASQYEI